MPFRLPVLTSRCLISSLPDLLKLNYNFSNSTVVPLQNATVHGATHDPITYFSTLPFPFDGVLPVYATSNDTTIADDACNPLPDSTPDLSTKLVIVRRGTCSFVIIIFFSLFPYSLLIQSFSGIEDEQHRRQRSQGRIDLRVSSQYHAYFQNDGFTPILLLLLLSPSNGHGFAGISVGEFKATLIQAADGEFVRFMPLITPWSSVHTNLNDSLYNNMLQASPLVSLSLKSVACSTTLLRLEALYPPSRRE